VGEWSAPPFLLYDEERDGDTGGIDGWIGSTYRVDVVAKRILPPAWNGVRSLLLY